MELKTLNALSTELSRLAFESEGEITEAMEEFTARLENKVDAYGWLLDDIPHRVAALKERIAALQTVVKRFDAMESALWFKLKAAMSTLNVSEIQGQQYKFKYVGCQKSLSVYDVQALPKEYFKVPEPDNKAIKIALTQGLEVPGAKLEGGTYLKCVAI